jgi:hypothetical protein
MTSDGPFTLIDDGREVETVARVDNGDAWLSASTLEAVGLVVTDPRLHAADGVGLDAVTQALGRPLAIDTAERAAWLGVSAEERARPLRDLAAPDFTLPDLAGRLHSLSEHRGKKRLLVAWGSW